MSLQAIIWLTANLTALVLLVVILERWTRDRPRARRRVLIGAAAALAGGAALFVVTGPQTIPTGWVAVLMEGRSIRNIRQLYGRGAHFGSGFDSLNEWVLGSDPISLPEIVHVNVCLAVINAVVFLVLARQVLPAWWAAIGFTALYALNLNTLNAAVSETPAMLWTTYFLASCLAGAVIADRHAGVGLRRLSLAALALLAWLASLLRRELLVIGGPAVAVALMRELGWDAQLEQALRRLGRWLVGLLGGPLWVLLAVLALLMSVQFLPWLGRASYLVDGLAPLNVSFLMLPQKLAVYLPVGLIALFVLGLAYTLRRWRVFLLLPVTVLMLFKVYASATQGLLEGFRYNTFLTPVVCVIALFGYRELALLAQRWDWPHWWRRAAAVVLVLSMTAWQPFGPREVFGRRHVLPGLASAEPLLGRNQQTEVRYMLDLVARYPHCALLTKVPRDESDTDRPVEYRWVAFGAPLPNYREMVYAGERPEEVGARLAPEASCVLFYRSLDCHLLETDGCAPEIAGRTPLEEHVLADLQYSDIDSYGGHAAELRLGVYRLGGAAPPRDAGLGTAGDRLATSPGRR